MQINVRGSIDKVAKTGRPYKSLEVSDDKGEVFKVNIFSNFPDFANIRQGSIIMGNLKQDGQYWNIEPEGVQMNRGGASGSFKTAQIEKVMETKRQDISKFQDNKENSIKIASTMRMAVDIATSLTTDQWQSTTMQEEIRYWREWCWSEWDRTGSDTMPPF